MALPRLRPYLIQCTHPSNGANVVGDGDQGGSGEVFLADGISLFLTHHVAKAMLEIVARGFKIILRQAPWFHQSTVESFMNNSVWAQMTWFGYHGLQADRITVWMVGCPFLNRDKVAWLLTGKKKKKLNASRYLNKNGTGETVAVFQDLLSKLPYFKHKQQELNISVLHQGQEIKSELQYHRSLHQAGGLTFKKNNN